MLSKVEIFEKRRSVVLVCSSVSLQFGDVSPYICYRQRNELQQYLCIFYNVMNYKELLS